MNSLWRSLSGASSKEIPHTHPSHTLRPTPSLDIGEMRQTKPVVVWLQLSTWARGCARHWLNKTHGRPFSACRVPHRPWQRRTQELHVASSSCLSGRCWQPDRCARFFGWL